METITVYLLILGLLASSALFSGLTLGYFTLDTAGLRRRAKLGDAKAEAILPLRERGNWLLTTLLFGNVAVNTVLSVFLGSIAGGLIASVIATSLIFMFGEIVPQAVISRHALWFGSLFSSVVKGLMYITAPITLSISLVLDRLLGDEIPTLYSRHEIMEIISEHEESDFSPIDADEERIIHGALQFSHRTVREVMTPLEKVVMYDENQRLTREFFTELSEEGFSRYPIYSGSKQNVVGLLFAKNLLMEDDNIAIKNTEEAFEKDFLAVKPGTYLDKVLTTMLKRRRHLAIVQNKEQLALGLITLEDIIEEIIQVEIEDEEDDED